MSVGIGIVGRQRILTIGGSSITGVQTKSVSINNEPLDTSDDNANGWREQLATVGSKAVDFSLDGLLKNLELVQAILQDTDSSQIYALSLTWPDGAVMTGEFLLVTMEESGENNGLTTYSSSWQSSGQVTFTAGV